MNSLETSSFPSIHHHLEVFGMWGGIPELGIQGLWAANLYFQLLGQIPGWGISPGQNGSTLPTPPSTVSGDSPPQNPAGDRIYCLENVGMQSPGGYLGIEELGMNLLVGLPEEFALFSEFKHRVCRRRRRNFLKRDIFSSVASPLLTTNSS